MMFTFALIGILTVGALSVTGLFFIGLALDDIGKRDYQRSLRFRS